MKLSSALTFLALAASQPITGTHAFAPSLSAPANLQQQRHASSILPTQSSILLSSATKLNMAVQINNGDNGDEETKKGPFVDLGTVGLQVANQALIGSTIWSGGASYQVLTQNAHLDPSGLALGVLGLIPLLAFSRKVETSESPAVAGLNLSTNAALLRMFGDTPQPQVAFAVSAFLAGMTGLVEEIIFRGQILPLTAQWSIQNLGLEHGAGVAAGAAISTLIFAALHANPGSIFRGKEAIQDNLVLMAFQVVTGGIFASLYVATHNLAVPIVAHALYDFVTFYKTHLDVTGQIQYAKNEKLTPSTEYDVETKWETERDEAFVNDAREVFYLMDSNQDGVLSRKELRVALFSYGINLSMVDSETVAETADVDGSGEIDFGEFLEFIGPQGSTEKAVEYAIFGTA